MRVSRGGIKTFVIKDTFYQRPSDKMFDLKWKAPELNAFGLENNNYFGC